MPLLERNLPEPRRAEAVFARQSSDPPVGAGREEGLPADVDDGSVEPEPGSFKTGFSHQLTTGLRPT